MQGVRRDGGVFYHAIALTKEFLCHGEFTIVLCTTITFHRDGAAVFVPTKGHDRSEAVPEIFAVKRQAFGQFVLVERKPLVECFGQGLGISLVDEVVEGIVTWHGEASIFIADVEPDCFALSLAEGSAALPDRFDIWGTHEKSVTDETEHSDFGITSGVGTAVIGNVVKSVREAAQMFAGQGATRSGNALAGSFLIDLRERRWAR